MPRTEKRFGDVSQPAAETFYEIVPASNTSTRNVLINIAGRSSGNVTVSAFTSAPQEPSQYSTVNISLSGVTTPTFNTGSNGMIINKTTSGIPSHGIVFNPGPSGYPLEIVSISGSSQSILAAVNGTSLSTNATRFNGYIIDTTTTGFDADYSESRPFSFPSAFLNDNLFVLTYPVELSFATATSAANSSYFVGNFTNISTASISTIARRGGVSGSTGWYGLSVLGPSNSTSALGYAVFSNLSPMATTPSTAGVWGLQMISESSGIPSDGTIVFGVTTSSVSMTAIRGASFFIASDYNSVYPLYAFSHPTATSADNFWYGQVSASASTNIGSVTLPADPSNAGFRLVDTSSTTSANIRKIFDGTITYPAAPTGVNVPSDHSKNQVASLKFSPNGKYLAVAYRRSGDITSSSDAVVVIYSRQNDGSYTYSTNSGTNITRSPKTTDSMAWTADSGGIIVLNDTSVSNQYRVQLWKTGLDSESSISQSLVTSWTDNWTKSPPAKSLISPSSRSAKLGTFSGDIVSTYSTAFNGAAFLLSYPLPLGDTLISTVPTRTGGNDSGSSNVIFQTTINGSIGSGTYPGYVNTFVSELPNLSGSLTQVSNIVVSPGESLHVESSTGDSVDISASGVEIT
jgi:hypothetical protein